MPNDWEPRFPGRTRKGHVESWFWRANDPKTRRAIWLKATVLAPRDRPPVAECWVAWFADGRVQAAKDTVPLDSAAFESGEIRVAGGKFSPGRLAGAVGGVRWDLAIRPEPGPLGARLRCFPAERMLTGGFPKNKLVSPMPIGRFDGWVEVAGERLPVTDWMGMHGHNWGPAHAPSYAWAQVVFRDDAGEPVAMVEAAAGKVEVGPVTTPTLGFLVARRGDREWRFDRIFDRWNHSFKRDDLAWRARFRGRAGEASLELVARPEEVACLGYVNPDGALRYCLNSKLSHARLRVNPINDDGFECVSTHGGALEFLQSWPDARVGEPV